MCLFLPYLSIERLGTAGAHQWDLSPSPDAHQWDLSPPIAVTENVGGTIRVVRCNGPAAECGVRPRMTLAEAQALLPSVRLVADDPQANLRALEDLAVWAQAFSPIVQLEAPETLLVDVTGCARLFGGEENLLSQALGGLEEKGFSARGAVANTPGAARAIAHAHRSAAVVTHASTSGTGPRDLEELARLPVGALGLDDRAVSSLGAVGVETIEALLCLPRASVVSRFGAEVLHRLDQALGNAHQWDWSSELLTPFRTPPVLRSHLRLGAATDRCDVLRRAAERVLAQFCEQLSRLMVGVTRLCVTFYCPGGDQAHRWAPVTFSVSVSQPTRSFRRLSNLLAVRLDRLRLPAKTDCVLLWAREVERLGARQEELFDSRPTDDRALAEFVDRISVRMGSRSVSRVSLVSDHQPERAYEYVPCVVTADGRRRPQGVTHQEQVPPPTSGTGPDARPLRVWSEPAEIPVVAGTSPIDGCPDGPLTMFRFRSVEHHVVTCVGPERVETGWWRGPCVKRDYFRVVTRSGEAFWIFRSLDQRKWFVHGVFD